MLPLNLLQKLLAQWPKLILLQPLRLQLRLHKLLLS